MEGTPDGALIPEGEQNQLTPTTQLSTRIAANIPASAFPIPIAKRPTLLLLLAATSTEGENPVRAVLGASSDSHLELEKNERGMTRKGWSHSFRPGQKDPELAEKNFRWQNIFCRLLFSGETSSPK
jgi:hypothetical protein